MKFFKLEIWLIVNPLVDLKLNLEVQIVVNVEQPG